MTKTEFWQKLEDQLYCNTCPFKHECPGSGFVEDGYWLPEDFNCAKQLEIFYESCTHFS